MIHYFYAVRFDQGSPRPARLGSSRPAFAPASLRGAVIRGRGGLLRVGRVLRHEKNRKIAEPA